MTQRTSAVRTWLPVVGAAGALVASVIYGWTMKSRADESVERLATYGTALTSLSEQVNEGAVPPDVANRLDSSVKDLAIRLEDSQKPHKVVTSISMTTRKVGAESIEIQPVATGPAAPGATEQMFPRYRVVLDGTVRQLAEFMDVCATERLPVRVVEFEITQTGHRGKDGLSVLHGNVVVEAFEPKPVSKGANEAT